jgi:ribonuclease P protein component
MRQRTEQRPIDAGGSREPAASPPAGATDGAPGIRVGFTTSRKVGGAVARNRARRRLRALAEEILPACGRPGCDYVLIGRPATPTRPFASLRSDFEAALARLHAGRGRSAPAAPGASSAGRARSAGRRPDRSPAPPRGGR